MILIYAFGSGLGHLKRVTSFLQENNYNSKDCLILTNSSFSNFWDTDCEMMIKDSSFFQSVDFQIFLKKLITEKNISQLIVDVFPSGFYGELFPILENFEGKKILLSRILSKKYFSKYPKISQFHTSYLMEKGIDLQEINSIEVHEYDLKISIKNDINFDVRKPYFLIIHSQPISEILYLYHLAKMHRKEQQIVIFSMLEVPKEKMDSETIVFYKNQLNKTIIEGAEKIFTAAGFNIVQLLKEYKNKWICTPFPRTFDNQFLRKKLTFEE